MEAEMARVGAGVLCTFVLLAVAVASLRPRTGNMPTESLRVPAANPPSSTVLDSSSPSGVITALADGKARLDIEESERRPESASVGDEATSHAPSITSPPQPVASDLHDHHSTAAAAP